MKQTKKQVKQIKPKAPKPKTPKKSKQKKEEELEFDDEFDFDSFDDIEEKPTPEEIHQRRVAYRNHIRSDKLIKKINFPIRRFSGQIRAEIEMENVSVDEVLDVEMALKMRLY